MTVLRPQRPPRADRTLSLILYTVITTVLLLLSENKLPGLHLNISPILVSFLFAACLGSVLLAYQWRAAGWARLGVGVLVLIIVLPWIGNGNGSFFDLAIQMGIFAALALGLNIVVGLAGLLDLGYVAFFAVGAYLWGIFGSGQFQQIVQSELPYHPLTASDWLWPLLLSVVGVLGLLWMRALDRAREGVAQVSGGQRWARGLAILLLVVGVFAALTLVATLINAAVTGHYSGHPQSLAALTNGVNGNLFWLFLALAVLAAAAVGVLIGLPVLKLKGDYLAIVTLGLGEVIRIFANNLTQFTNGPQGITSIESPPVGIFDRVATALNFPPEELKLFFLYFLVLVVIGIVILVNVRLDRSRIGRAWIAIREDEVAAQAMGVPLVRTKLLAFATGASFAGIMGVIFAAKQQYISPESFNYFQSIGVLTMVILGGMGNIPGVILGAGAVTLLNLSVLPALSETLQSSFPNMNSLLDPAKYQRLLFGAVLVLMMLFRPEGLLPTARRQHELHEGDETPIDPNPTPAPDSLAAEARRDATDQTESQGYASRDTDERSGGVK